MSKKSDISSLFMDEPETRTLKPGEMFQIEADGTFHITFGRKELLFELMRDTVGSEDKAFVRLIAPESAVTLTIEDEDSHEWAKLEALEKYTWAGGSVPPFRTMLVKAVDNVHDIDIEAVDVAELCGAAIRNNARLVFVVNNTPLNDDLEIAKAKLRTSGIVADLIVRGSIDHG